MFEDDEECEHEDAVVAGAPMTIWDFICVFFAFLAGVGQAFTEAMTFLCRSAAMANNHAAAQKEFAEAARREIEAIPVAKDDT